MAFPSATKEAVRTGGWPHTGDLGAIDDRGRLKIAGRGKGMFVVGGFNACGEGLRGAQEPCHGRGAETRAAGFKVPRYVAFRGALPLNATGSPSGYPERTRLTPRVRWIRYGGADP